MEQVYIKALLWQQTKTNKDGKKFPITKITLEGETFDCVIKKETLKQLQTSGFNFPYEVEFGEDDYFVKKESYEKDNEKRYNYKFVLVNYHSVTQGEFEKRSIADVIQERKQKRTQQPTTLEDIVEVE